jgi:hypothetical protein
VNHLGLEQPDDRLGHSVVVGIASAANRGVHARILSGLDAAVTLAVMLTVRVACSRRSRTDIGDDGITDDFCSVVQWELGS